ncbi:transcriptional activator FtrA [Streptomyces rimosus subsp. rimosus]|nr:transcriptional activator FtrA [Streptomyces rimosus subsp. rimosus]UTH95039.1 transcriptional activator FtrA [Streptomyces rimosus subsp. rimosus]UTJ13136.1 transcriptional activator FtrA [Streptomyces rimosus subsp. rimosus]
MAGRLVRMSVRPAVFYAHAMDALTGLLDGPRARGAFLMRSVLTPPWSLRIQDEAPLTVVTMARGEGWVVTDAVGEPRGRRAAATPLHPGDVAILRGPDPYTVADDPATPPRVVIHPGQVSATPQGVELCEVMALGVRTWGDGPDGPVVLLSGTYQMRGEVNQRLLRALPPLVRLPADAWNSSLVPLLEAEIGREAPGQEVVLDRLLDLLLTAALRAWFARPEAEVPGGYDAQSDPVVGRALRQLHADPARAWTVAGLAAASGVSRAALGRRFTALVGEPPMTYLTNLRLTLAADLLREPDATLGAVARRVGYGSPFALSAAFKRVRGVSPRDHRRRGAAPHADVGA